MNAPTLRYAYWHHKQGSMVYAVKLAERDGVRVVVGAVGPLAVATLTPDEWTEYLPYYKYRDNHWLARVLDGHQDEYEEVTL